MSSTDLLINPSTKKQVELFIKSQFPCLALIGSKGSGRKFLAEWITDQLLGQNKVMTSANTFYIDGASEGIESVREAQKNISLITPGYGRFRKALIIDSFDEFGHEAQNAMLKTLEEPPNDTLIIITISRQSNVLQTIYSRTRQIVVKPITKKDIEKSYSNISQEKINSAYALSMGQAGLFVSILNETDHPLTQAIQQAKLFLKQTKDQQLSTIDSLTKSKEPEYLANFLEALQRIFFAAYQASISKDKISSSLVKKLEAIKHASENIDNGLNKKLALTQLILKI